MNFNDALTHAKNTYLPEEIMTELVLGVAYDPEADNETDGYPAYTISFEFIPAMTRNAYWKDECNEAGEVVDGYRAYFTYFALPDTGDNGDNIESFTANSYEELLAQLPAFAATLNYQVYTPSSNSDLVVELVDLLRDLFPDLPAESDDSYKQAAINAITKYNSGVLPTGLTTQDIEAHFSENPTMTMQEAFDHILSDFNIFVGNRYDAQMLGAVAAPKTSLVDVYVIALSVTPAELRMEAPHTTDGQGNTYNEYCAHIQGGAYGKPATVNSYCNANSIEELLELLPPMFDHVKYHICLMSDGHVQHTTEQVLRKMFPSLLATDDEIERMKLSAVERYKADLRSKLDAKPELPALDVAEDLLAFQQTAFEVIRKSNF